MADRTAVTPKGCRLRFPHGSRIHVSDGNRLVTKCGLVYVDLFATPEAGRMLAYVVSDKPTCRRCLRISL